MQNDAIGKNIQQVWNENKFNTRGKDWSFQNYERKQITLKKSNKIY